MALAEAGRLGIVTINAMRDRGYGGPFSTALMASVAAYSMGVDTIDSTIGIRLLREEGMEIYSQTAKEKELFRQAAQKPVIECLEK